MFIPVCLSSSSHRYWRVRASLQTTVGGSNYRFGVTEIEMRATTGSSASDLCTGGTAMASSTSSPYLSANAFNGIIGAASYGPDDSADWLANASGVGEWIGYDFGTPVAPVELWLYPINVLGAVEQAPSLAVDYSDDGAAWVQSAEYTGLTWVLDTAKTFAI